MDTPLRSPRISDVQETRRAGQVRPESTGQHLGRRASERAGRASEGPEAPRPRGPRRHARVVHILICGRARA